MSVTTDLQTTWEEKVQREDCFTARATLENATNVTMETNRKIQEIIDSGHFDTIPDDLKMALNRWRNMFKTLEADMKADAEIVAVFDWRP
ncbi:unnamed protein product [marine sediment metagenome]|uniref:Uncharacterized protein n=1 Tax=marine sediment metagenome TaxID=412755 RepID=X0XRS8_9ZZZZ